MPTYRMYRGQARPGGLPIQPEQPVDEMLRLRLERRLLAPDARWTMQ
nr:hypothetical protein [Ralstonia solanacearum]